MKTRHDDAIVALKKMLHQVADISAAEGGSWPSRI
jgi:hypothetical protein